MFGNDICLQNIHCEILVDEHIRRAFGLTSIVFFTPGATLFITGHKGCIDKQYL